MANQFLPFATGGGANVIDQATYTALAARLAGFVDGIAEPTEVNKVWRQSAFMAAMIGQFISDHALLDALDDGDLTVLKNRLEVAIRRQDLNYVGAIGGTANALTVTLAPAPVSYTVLIGTPLRLLAAASNTAAATLNVNGLGVKNILRQDGSALGVNDIRSGDIITVIYDGTQFRLFSLIPQTDRAFTLFASAQSLPNTTETGVVFAAPGGGTDPLGFYNAGQPGWVFDAGCIDVGPCGPDRCVGCFRFRHGAVLSIRR
jgi:hypothetical protein